MTELLTAAQMRAFEAAAIASGSVTGLDLMERAGRGVVAAIFAEWPELAAGSFRAVVLCGPGNNGGDGFVVARLLKQWGWEVAVYLYGTPEGMPPDARVNYERWVGMGVVRVLSTNVDTWEADLVIDALFGLGLTRGFDTELEALIAHIAHHLHADQKVCAVDCPSGLCLDSGKVLLGSDRKEHVVQADLTVTFASRKIGHILARGPSLCGKLVVADIGIHWHDGGLKAVAAICEPAPCVQRLRNVVVFGVSEVNEESLSKRSNGSGHKFSHGYALILSGGPGHGGAARLSARGALRIGAGLVTLACPPEALAENAGRLDAIMLKVVTEGAGLAEVLTDDRINALCLGPGLGLDARAADLVRVALAARGGVAPRPAVLDADALTLLSRDAALFAALHPACVLTPHAGEFARLFPDIAAKLDAPATQGPAYSKVDATREAAARAGCTVLFKGPDTVIASPDGTCAINSAAYDRAAPWLATAGSGDVLAGFITGLLARGFAPQQAAETGAWLHVESARSFGPGLIAEDLPDELPKVFRALGL